MAKLYFKELKKAKRIAKKRGQWVYKINNEEYFVGTYQQAIFRLGIIRGKKKIEIIF